MIFALSHEFVFAAIASLVCGMSWTVILSVLYVSAQLGLAHEVRGRGLGVFLTAIFGCVTAGAAVWGQIAAAGGLTFAFLAAAAGATLMIPLSRHWKLNAAQA